MNKGNINIGEVVNLDSLSKEMDAGATYALIKTEDMEVIRMVIPGGKHIPEHKVKGQLTVQCLKGEVQFSFEGNSLTLRENDWICLDKKTMHSLKALNDSVLLLTILF